MQKYYYAIIEEGKETFGASFPDFPGCIGVGDTVALAIESGASGLQFHIDEMICDGDTLPDPSDPGSFEDDPEVTVACIAAISVQIPGPMKRVNITIPEDLWDRIGHVAGNKSGWIAEAAREKLKAGA